MNKWQPIDTAPKDGTVILGYEKRGIVSMYWETYFIRPEGEVFGFWELGVEEEESDDMWTPTHWMPLPPPPQEATP